MICEQVSTSVTLLRPAEGQSSESFKQELRERGTKHRDDYLSILKSDHDAAFEHLEAAKQKLRNTEKALRHFRFVSEDVWPHAQPLQEEEVA